MYKPQKNLASYIILLGLIILNFGVFYFTKHSMSYTISIILKILLVIFDIYQLYYIILGLSLNYEVGEEYMTIKGLYGLKTINIYYKDITGYNIQEEIDGIKLSGISFNNFIIGRCYIEKLGTTRMYTTSKDEVVYILTDKINFAITPAEVKKFEQDLKEKGMKLIDNNERRNNEKVNLHRDKVFMIPLVITTILSFIMVIVPFIYYLKGNLGETMPLSFDPSFNPTKIGTGKQFAFQQMMYGALNLALIFCMYFAAQINSKYDRKSSYKYIYIALAVAITFMVLQIKIFSVYL